MEVQGQMEVLLRETPSRFVVFPLQFKTMWQYYKKHIENFWTADEMEVHDDVANFDKLNHDERAFIVRQLASLCSTAEIFHCGLISDVSVEVQAAEARSFYGFQVAMERFHLEVYQKAVESFVAEGHERDQVFSYRKTDESIKRKIDWALSLSSELVTFDEKLIGISVILGILHAAEFASLFGMSVQKNLLNIKKAISHISSDKGLHRDFGMYLRTYLIKKTEKSRIKEIVEKAVEFEMAFIDGNRGEVDGIDLQKLKQYVRFSADQLMTQMDCQKIYNVENPLQFMKGTDYNSIVKVAVVEDAAVVEETSSTDSDGFDLDAAF
ncbi:hypothetical protein L596_014651 [Steinernema carpocapsae]|nr:hypothetical protein L596_014651 [Steinernema carpocapsae]